MIIDLYELPELLKNQTIISNEIIEVRGRLELSRNKNKLCFLVLRDHGITLQIVLHKSSISEKEFKLACDCHLESLVQLTGKLVDAKVKSCSIQKYEIQCQTFEVINQAKVSGIPINKNFIYTNPDTAHEFRVLDMRNNTNQWILMVKSKIVGYCQDYFKKHQFIQIQTPKLISTASEGGAEVFKLKYFNKDAFLAQSPQLYKQMAINCELPRVFEIGSVFRAENSNSKRHLTEFTGIDMEMRIKKHYHEVVHHLWNLVVFVIDNLVLNDNQLLTQLNSDFDIQYPTQPLILKYKDGVELLKKDGITVETTGITGAQEKRLGELVKQKYNSDLFVLDEFPSSLRPFYTKSCHETPEISRSYDIILRGMEILSGAQRVDNYSELISNLGKQGVDETKIKHYLESFQYGSYPHGGGGFGLERLTMNLLGLDNIRQTCLFYRDPKRLAP